MYTNLAAAKVLLSGHHGTRGAAITAMGDGDGWTKKGHGRGTNHRPNDWRCEKCSRKDVPHWVYGNKSCCNICSWNKPKIPQLYSQSKQARKADGGKGGGKGDGGKGGPRADGGKGGPGQGGKAADESKRIKELEKELKEYKEKLQEKEDEFHDAEDEHDDTAGESVKDWQEQLDAARQETKELQKKLKEAKAPSLASKWERRISENKAECEDLQAKVWSAQNPQEQLEKKAAKCRRLTEGQPALLERVRRASEKQQEALEEASKHEAEAKRLSDLWTKNGQEIIRLNSESHEVLRGVRRADTDIGQYITESLNEKFRVFEDPVFAGDATVAAKSKEFKEAREAIATATNKLEAVCGSLVEYASSFKARAVEEAEKTAAVAAERAEEAKRAAATPLPTGGAEEELDAARKDDSLQNNQPKAGETAAAGSGKTCSDAKTGENKQRTDEKSRSPAPRRGSQTPGTASGATATAPGAPTTTLDRALSKPARQRSEAEVILAASAGKIGKWADQSQMDEDDL